MVIDASALTAILLAEADGRSFLERLEASKSKLTSPLAVWETAVAVSRGLQIDVADATIEVDTFLATMEIVSVAIPPETATLALQTFARYGKGRHPAKLNFGDCFSYACAKVLKQPLLYKGNDFAQTDIETA